MEEIGGLTMEMKSCGGGQKEEGQPYPCSWRKGTFKVDKGKNDTTMWFETE